MLNLATVFARPRGLLVVALGVFAVATATAVILIGLSVGPQESSDSVPAPAISAPDLVKVQLTDRGPAPDFQKIDAWLNGDPATVGDLHGTVVLIDFWTLGCINCRRTLPYVRQWHDRYAAHGLKVIGVHTPEFAYEKDHDRVVQAMSELGVNWTVAIDNQKGTWRAWHNRYWPRKYLIDAGGNVRYDRIGEGAYQQTEYAIRALLQENGADLSNVPVGGIN